MTSISGVFMFKCEGILTLLFALSGPLLYPGIADDTQATKPPGDDTPALAAGIDFYVSFAGNDENPGTKQLPFATITKARNTIRGRAPSNGPMKVFIRGGVYYLPETLTLDARDSGTKENPVTYEAVPNEEVVISGGSKLNLNWAPFRDGIMQATVPIDFSADQIFVDGKRQQMARYPNFDPSVRHFNGYAADAFSLERASKYSNPSGGFMHAMHNAEWGDYHYLVTGKNNDGALTYEGGWQNNRQGPMHRNFRFIENVFEELDTAGEWFHNPTIATLYFLPPDGVDMKSATIEAVRLKHLVELQGSQGKPVRFITLKGLTFRHASRTFMDNKEPLLRSDWTTYRGGAIVFSGAEDCELDDCTIDQVGGNAIFVDKYNRRISIRHSQIAQAGGNGIAFVGDPDAVRSPLFEYRQVQDLEKIDRSPGPKSDNYPAECLVEDCLIWQTGRFEKQTSPVQIAMSMGITVRHCSIYDVPRAGINIGDGTWGGHVVEFCDVFDTVKETGDHGSFNSWGRDRYWHPNIQEVDALVKNVPELPYLDMIKPTILRNNRWRCDHGWDIDLDDGSSRYELTNNLCLNGGIKLREGYGRLVENNIMVGNSFHPHVWYSPSQDVFRRNIVFKQYQPIRVAKPWGKEIDFNLLNEPGKSVATIATTLQSQSGRDENSLIADAMFVDPMVGDYRLREGSPALKLGFKNFPMDQFGVTTSKLKAIARTPSLPASTQSGIALQVRDQRVQLWRGAKIKNVISLGERSAAGLPSESGVLLTEVETESIAAKAGLKIGDVILKAGNTDTHSVADFLKAVPSDDAQPLKLEIWRTQQRVILEVGKR